MLEALWLHGGGRLARLLLGCGLLAATALAQAQVPYFWLNSGTATPYGSYCSGSCHLTPPAFTTGTHPVPNLQTSVVESDANFKSYFVTFAVPNGSPMSTFNTNAPQADWDRLRQYFMDVVDARVTSTSASVSPVPSNSSAVTTSTVNFGTLLGGGSSSVSFKVESARSGAITLGTPSTSGGDAGSFVVGTPSCTTVNGNYGNDCTFTVQFNAGSTAGSKSTTLLIGFSAASGPTPATRRVLLQGATNLVPVANAGGTQSVAKNATVTLDGRSSSDSGGSIASYAWTVTRPDTTSFALTGSQPTFTAAQVGTYNVSLVVTDNLGATSSPATTTVTVTNTAPTALPSVSASSTRAPATVNLQGSGTDPNGDTITAYSWTVVAQPLGSAISLSPSTSAQNPSFSAVKSGTYTLGLRVSDGSTLSAVAQTSISLDNTAPTASAGPTQNVTAPTTVNLSGATASDANGDALTYAWVFKGANGRPAGSAATISNATSLTGASFNADKSGTYTLTLTVTDTVGGGTAASDITINAANTPPVVSAGTSRTVTVNQPVTLGGTATDANGDSMTYSWAVARPGGGSVVLSNGSTLAPSFTPDVTGAYSVTLTANDGQGGSTTSAAITITAQNAAVANAGSNQLVATGSTVTLDGSGSTTSGSGSLGYAWTLTTRPGGSSAVLAGANTVAPSFVADVSGSYTATLQVTDSLGTSPAASVTITADRAPVANAGSAQSTLTGTLVTLDGSASSDADGDTLTYAWTLPTRPGGSSATLSGASGVRPTFTPDVAGSYVASLVVSDGRFSSSAATVAITVNNPPPLFGISGTSFSPSAQLTLSTPVSAVITNGGGLPLVLGTLTFGGAAGADYTLAAGNGCTAGLSIAPGASCTLVVNFAPAGLNSRVGTLAITHNATGSPATLSFNGTGLPAPQGRIALGALSITFPATQVATSTAQGITVQNTGDLALTFAGFDLAGAAAGDYAKSGTCSTATPLAIGASCTITVTFTPTAVGSRSATLTVRSDASNGAAVVTLGGTATPIPAPAVTLAPVALDFGNQTVGGLYPARTVTLTNSGTAELASIDVQVSGTGFARTGAACPASLAVNASCTLTLTFTPATAGLDYTGTLRLTSNASGSPHTVALAGRGTTAVVPSLAWAPGVTRLEFGNVNAGSVSAVQSATLTNNGPGGATISLLNAIGPESAAFSVTAGTCVLGQVLFEGQQCSVDVRFAPGSAGAKSATVQVAGNLSAPADLVLAGTGLGGPSPSLALSASTLAFNGVRVGARSLPAELTLKGSGSGIVTVLSMAVGGGYAVQNLSCPALPFALPAGAECTMSVTFTPQAEGSAAGKLTITTDGTPATLEVALSGSGEPQADDGGGGCSIARGDTLADPTLWLLALGALAALAYRRRGRR